jgi:hypothetical protein
MSHETEELADYADRRSALRQGCRVETLVAEHESAGLMTAVVLDLSRQGFRLVLPVQVHCGDEIILHPPSGYDLLKIRATIVRQSVSVEADRKVIECGAEVADTAAWRKHSWFLALRTGSIEYEDAKRRAEEAAAA